LRAARPFPRPMDCSHGETHQTAAQGPCRGRGDLDEEPDHRRRADFVFQNWHEGATHENGAAGAFFTPFGLACDFALDGAGRRVIDLCAGIGVLSYIIHHRSKWGERLAEITCVEINPRYVSVGRKLLPQARWINADVFDWRTLDLVIYDVAIANPPFGRVGTLGRRAALSRPGV